MTVTSGSEFEWPHGAAPSDVPVLARNVALVDASPEIVWHHLIGAERWPQWYPYAKDVRIAGGAAELGETSAFTWHTVGVFVRSRVRTFVPNRAIAWTASAIGTEIYHAWRIDVVAAGRCRVVSEETQRGWLPTFAAPILSRIMREHHEVWLEHLKAIVLAAENRAAS